MHVGEAVCHRHRQLLAARALGDAGADRVRQGELAAQVVGLARRDAEVGAHGGDPVDLRESGAGLPAVAQLLLLIGEAEVLARVVDLRLDPSDLVRSGVVVKQQDDQALHRLKPLEPFAAGEPVAGPGGEQAALAVVEHDRRGGASAVADAGDQLPGAAEHRGEPFDPFLGDFAARVGGELQIVERDPFDCALDVLGGDYGHVEQRGGWQQRRLERGGCRLRHGGAPVRSVDVGCASGRARVVRRSCRRRSGPARGRGR